MLHFNIQKEPGSPIMKQIYQGIRSKILNGELKAGTSFDQGESSKSDYSWLCSS